MNGIHSQSKLLLLLLLIGLVSGCSRNDDPDEEPAPTNTAPAITDPGALSVTEGTASVATIEASDPDGDSVTLSVSGGSDEAAFALEDGFRCGARF